LGQLAVAWPWEPQREHIMLLSKFLAIAAKEVEKIRLRK
jgi:Tfp pilus assembly protein PilN